MSLKLCTVKSRVTNQSYNNTSFYTYPHMYLKHMIFGSSYRVSVECFRFTYRIPLQGKASGHKLPRLLFILDWLNFSFTSEGQLRQV